jgi:hypothetical protein
MAVKYSSRPTVGGIRLVEQDGLVDVEFVGQAGVSDLLAGQVVHRRQRFARRQRRVRLQQR